MDSDGAKRILMDLYNGINPVTGEILPEEQGQDQILREESLRYCHRSYR